VVSGFGNSSPTSNILAVAQNPAGAASGLNLGLVKGTLTLPGLSTPIANLQVLARALQTSANANILSTPTLLTLDNEQATISVAQNVPFLTGQFTLTGTSGTASPFQTIERHDVGLTLKVKPQISEGGTVRMQISQEVSSLQTSASAAASLTPITNKRSIDTTVLVDDGQIVVLGGLIEDHMQDTEDKVPLLGDIPGLGHLFRYTSRQRTKTNLMVFLRPVVVRDAATAAALTHPRYDYIVGQQKASTSPHSPVLPDEPAPTLQYDMTLGNVTSHQGQKPAAP
jgi:general secretion pathway protein D